MLPVLQPSSVARMMGTRIRRRTACDSQSGRQADCRQGQTRPVRVLTVGGPALTVQSTTRKGNVPPWRQPDRVRRHPMPSRERAVARAFSSTVRRQPVRDGLWADHNRRFTPCAGGEQNRRAGCVPPTEHHPDQRAAEYTARPILARGRPTSEVISGTWPVEVKASARRLVTARAGAGA